MPMEAAVVVSPFTDNTLNPALDPTEGNFLQELNLNPGDHLEWNGMT
jgi:hypothetical protein